MFVDTEGSPLGNKPKRLQKIEDYWQDQHRQVYFEEPDAGYWHVYVKGFFADFELAEIAEALKLCNTGTQIRRNVCDA